MNKYLASSIIKEIDYGYISYGNLHSNDDEGLKLIAEALKKQIPKRLDRSKKYGFCKCPEGHNIPKVCESGRMRYCPFCGQHILWEDEET